MWKIKYDVESVLLLLILLLSVYFVYLPHAEYDYPLHRDEWDRITLANAYLKYGGPELPDPFTGNGTIKNHPEIGFIVFISLFKVIGIDWLTFFWYSPFFLSLLLVFSGYLMGRKLGYGVESAFFIALIPTTVRFLGPAFFVPVSLALPFMLMILFSAFYLKERSHPIIFVFSVFLLYMHPPSAIAIFIALSIYIILERDMKMAATVFLAAITAVPHFISYIRPVGSEGLVFTAVGAFKSVINEFGYIPSIFFITGFYLSMKGWKKEDVVISFTTAVLLFLIVFYRYMNYLPLLWPERVLLYLMLFMSLVAAKGLHWVRGKSWPVGVLFALVILAFSYQSHVEIPYYHIVDDQEYEDYLWIRDNLEGRAILDPWEAIAFTAIANKPVFTVVRPTDEFKEKSKELIDFFSNNCSDTEFLIKNNISIVYYKGSVNNRELKEVRDSIYYLSLK